MSMTQKFKTAKIQLTLVGEKHPKGAKHILNNVTETISEEQFSLLSSVMETLTGEKVTNANVIETQSIVMD
ncbi:hypothetical protein [Limosilactobacillus fastidiosus]|uniref:DUF1659 domain-containing protein n=1 Tax=Limosilactobacillus fastidiosus TaxID=2759855 RepID=A0A7W3TZB6_9LACO|nr:hypothetical protein [Limosilactobacillus fastidiosus]MBB1063527.1 hypothetical protein [Limosilactobacillus fastidiosus]MBB1086052.1 hypothetical protein [Limosilactobacillus fastidiosus]MCD7084892.1 hypothetical protein [Limosilactobacillus fastidiosus]MCD7085607.1 hypothetical protein [Limosilactobacillus fastidiosus]MCD7114185.1 hypothetical protein [Limosilactobacillus fastidiosus]